MLSHLSVSFPLIFGESGFECGIQTTLSGFLDFFFVCVKCLIFSLFLSAILTRRSVAKAISLISWYQFVYWVLRGGFR